MGYVIAAYGITLVVLVGYGLHVSRERGRERARLATGRDRDTG